MVLIVCFGDFKSIKKMLQISLISVKMSFIFYHFTEKTLIQINELRFFIG